jgi:hypothetical protein
VELGRTFRCALSSAGGQRRRKGAMEFRCKSFVPLDPSAPRSRHLVARIAKPFGAAFDRADSTAD